MTTATPSLLEAAFTQSWNAIVITDADAAHGYRVEMANPAFCAMTGYSLDELKGRSLKQLQGPQTDPEVIAQMRRCLQEARYFEGTAVNYRKDGSSYIVHWNISPVRDAQGVLTHFLSVQQDISEWVRTSQENQLLARALDAASDQIVLTDAEARITFANAAFTKVTGYTLDDIKGQTPAVLRSGQHSEAFYQALKDSLLAGQDFRATFVNRRRDGSLYHAEQSISSVTDDKGRITHFVSVSKDISALMEKREALIQEARTDGLTGLYNRRHGEAAMAQAVQAAHAGAQPLTLIACDVDHFKQVNDQFGHPAGDRVLKNVARLLLKHIRSSDTAIRWGGEEFFILLINCPAEAARQLAERIRRAMASHHDEEAGAVTLSLGVATLQPDESLAQWISRTDSALYEAKRSGRNRLVMANGQ